jgi:signal transduction histidine kinase
VEVEVDPGQMRQVLLNLLLNALDASSGGHRVTVQMSQLASSNATDDATVSRGEPQWIVVEVVDEGSGLPTAMGDRIFEPFVSTKEEGAGLGLPICKRIVEDHGGEITAGNRLEGGAVFTVKLPVSASAENPVGTHSIASDEKSDS